MKKCIMLVLTLFLTAGLTYAGEQGGFWDSLIKRLNAVASGSGSQRVYTSVMGIRGAEDVDDDSLYWKGEVKEPFEEDLFVSEAEAGLFADSVSRAAEGAYETALAGFHDFIATYPVSPLAVDAREAIEKLENIPAAPEAASGDTDRQE